MTKKKPLGVGLSREERMVLVIGEIIQELLKAHDEMKDVNLNRLKTRIASKYGLDTSPRLVDIIAAVPHEAKKVLLPKLKAKPIRTASGVRFHNFCCNFRDSQYFHRLRSSRSCANLIGAHTSTTPETFVYIVPADPTVTLNIQHRATQATSPLQCGRYERDTIRSCRHAIELNS